MQPNLIGEAVQNSCSRLPGMQQGRLHLIVVFVCVMVVSVLHRIRGFPAIVCNAAE